MIAEAAAGFTRKTTAMATIAIPMILTTVSISVFLK
jgi:hypothetical protein